MLKPPRADYGRGSRKSDVRVYECPRTRAASMRRLAQHYRRTAPLLRDHEDRVVALYAAEQLDQLAKEYDHAASA